MGCRDSTIKILGDPIVLPRFLTEEMRMALSDTMTTTIKHDFESAFSNWLYFFLRGFANASGDKTPFLSNIRRNSDWYHRNGHKIRHPAGRLWHLHDHPYLEEVIGRKINFNDEIALYKSRVVPVKRKKEKLFWNYAFRDILQSMKKLNLNQSL